jgi:hypothetical protein
VDCAIQFLSQARNKKALLGQGFSSSALGSMLLLLLRGDRDLHAAVGLQARYQLRLA